MTYVEVPVLATEIIRQTSPSDICNGMDKDKAQSVIKLCLSKLSDIELQLLARQIDVELCKETESFSL